VPSVPPSDGTAADEAACSIDWEPLIRDVLADQGRGVPREETAERNPFPEVVGWQPLILNQPKICADCEEPIERSERCFAGMTAAILNPHS